MPATRAARLPSDVGCGHSLHSASAKLRAAVGSAHSLSDDDATNDTDDPDLGFLHKPTNLGDPLGAGDEYARLRMSRHAAHRGNGCIHSIRVIELADEELEGLFRCSASMAGKVWSSFARPSRLRVAPALGINPTTHACDASAGRDGSDKRHSPSHFRQCPAIRTAAPAGTRCEEGHRPCQDSKRVVPGADLD